MAKRSGDTRVSKWRGINEPLSVDLYYEGGHRVEYKDLSESGKDAVKKVTNELTKVLRAKFQGKKVEQSIDNSEIINVYFTRTGIEHLTRDAMLVLSGKYFSRASMMRIDEIFKNSKYLPTEHGLSHPRTDGRDLWFAYKDSEGRGVYFKVAYNSAHQYELYSVTDVKPK